ncbi:MAG: hypothetical protein IT384_12815 [Deltaproteobacteria bacterium]|nr:hypothetical protein [Deltaproteobacteria bacterium]
MPRAGLPVLVCGALTACAQDGSVWVGYPESGGAASLLIAVDQPAGARRFAIALDAPAPSRGGHALEAEPGATLEAALFSETLEEIGIVAGEQPAVPMPACPIPRGAIGTFVAELAVDQPVTWRSSSSYGPLLAGVPLEDRRGACRCAGFDAEVGVLPDRALARLLLGLDGSRALAVMADQTLRIFSRARRTASSTVGRAAALSALTFLSGTTDSDGALWLGTDQGEIWEATLGSSLDGVRVETTPSGSPIVAILVLDSGAPELLVIDRAGKLLHARAAAWSERFSFGPVSEAQLAIDPMTERVVAVTRPSSKAVTFDRGQVAEAPLPHLRGSVRVLAHVPGSGFIAGTEEGELLQLGPPGWTILEDEGVSRGIHAVVPYDDGFIYGGDFGFLAEVRPRLGRCEINATAAEMVGRLVSMGGDLLALPIGHEVPISQTRVTFFAQRR